MKQDLLMEYMKFKHVASIQQANLREHEAASMNYRLEALRLRYEEYSEKGLDLEEVRKLEKAYLDKLRAATNSL